MQDRLFLDPIWQPAIGSTFQSRLCACPQSSQYIETEKSLFSTISETNSICLVLFCMQNRKSFPYPAGHRTSGCRSTDANTIQQLLLRHADWDIWSLFDSLAMDLHSSDVLQAPTSSGMAPSTAMWCPRQPPQQSIGRTRMTTSMSPSLPSRTVSLPIKSLFDLHNRTYVSSSLK
jgi:hypothetical protein